MLAGHIGVAAAAKSFDRKVPFWALLVASFLIDIVFGVLWIFGAESMEALPGTDGGYGNMMFEIDYSHSFFGTLLLCLVVLIFTARRWGGRGAFILSCVVFSHWFLDLIVHRNDMPIMPGNAGGTMPRVGLGMWDAPVATAIFEALIVIGGAYLWFRSRPQDVPGKSSGGSQITRYASYALAGGLVALVIDFVG
jgi:membrane-bound metal-dependent hydrolase YbcI (DUF457 family)